MLQDTATAIRAPRLLTHSSAELIEDGVVLVRDGRIEVARPWLTYQSQTPSDAIVRDLGDVAKMPGFLIVHSQMDPSAINTSTEIKLKDPELLSLMKKNALRLLDAGVTTTCDLGSKVMTAIQLRNRFQKGKATGPGYNTQIQPLTVPKRHGGGVDGVREEVRKSSADGFTALADAGYSTRELFAAATDVAAKHCGLANETGKLEAGLAADVVAFAGNPLEDLGKT